MQSETRHFAMDDGVIVVADAYGNPADRPILFAHGGGQTRHSWGGTAKALAQIGWYALAYDHRGHGDSGWSGDGVYRLQRFAADQKAIARQLSHPPVVVGASLGGLSADLLRHRAGRYHAEHE
jgi:pimeloyl-ACP methyl ester carboxylesterase